jgi:hypothetical protein
VAVRAYSLHRHPRESRRGDGRLSRGTEPQDSHHSAVLTPKRLKSSGYTPLSSVLLLTSILLPAEKLAASSVSLTWSASTSVVTGYNVYPRHRVRRALYEA